MKVLLISAALLFSASSHACIGGIFNARAQALDTQLQAEQQAADKLMQLADKRFEAESKYGKNILDAWISYTTERGKLEREFNRAPIKIREAELSMEREQIKVKKECREKANEYQTAQTQEVTNNPVTRNPTSLAGSYRRLNNQYQIAYRQCLRDPLVLEEMQIAVKNYNLQVQSIRQDQDDAITKIQELTRVTNQQQQYQIRRRTAHRNLFDFNEGVIRQMQARAISMTQRSGSLRATGAALNCFMQLIQGASGGSGSSASRNNNRSGNSNTIF